ncbi:MAG: hypothetical protein A2293_01565 [Elusimicrobia bacterium RIFOXYB2_FULL_49_7]|nr:MAG: hypothetical protein A2293_01565 [Elusimicrobia bacterium RIFOXYB2_FULL_49_7]
MLNPDVKEYIISTHARFEMGRRGLTETDIGAVVTQPQQKLEIRPGRCIYQSMVCCGEPPKEYLDRVVIDVDRSPAVVVTVYRTSKVKNMEVSHESCV